MESSYGCVVGLPGSGRMQRYVGRRCLRANLSVLSSPALELGRTRASWSSSSPNLTSKADKLLGLSFSYLVYLDLNASCVAYFARDSSGLFSSQARRRFCFNRPVRSVGIGAFTYLVLPRGIYVSLGLASGSNPLDVALLGTERF